MAFKDLFGDIVSGAGTVLGLPEFGLSEAIKGQPSPLAASKQKPAGPVGLTGSSSILGAANQQTTAPTAPTAPAGGGAIGTGGAIADIEANFRANIQELENLGGEARGTAGLATKGVRSEFGRAGGDIRGLAEEAQGEFGLAEETVGQEETSALRQARQLSGELGQRNIAQLSALGISDSSAAAALQERLGRDTFAAINSITQNRQQAITNIGIQRSKVENDFKRQLANLKEQEAQAVEQINLNLQSALNRINESKTLASNQKAAARNQIVTQAQQAAANAAAAIQKEQAKAALQSQGVVNAFAALTAFAGGNLGLEAFADQMDNINNNFTSAGLSDTQVKPATILNMAISGKAPSSLVSTKSAFNLGGLELDEEQLQKAFQ